MRGTFITFTLSLFLAVSAAALPAKILAGVTKAAQFAPQKKPAVRSNKRTKIMQISFVKSGGFPGPMGRVEGTVDLKSQKPNVSGDAAYHRELSPQEIETLSAGAQPEVLSQAVAHLAAAQSAGKGAADLEHYTVSLKTWDGKTHNVTFNTSGSSTEMAAVSPPAAKFMQWLQQEARDILSTKMKSK